jgi:signal peptidase I
MAPRLCPGDIVWVGREGVSSAVSGAVVAWRPPGEASIRLDRVVGVSGTTVEMSGGVLRIDGVARTTRPYGASMEEWEGALLPVTPGPDFGAERVGDGDLFLLSDDRRVGGDSQAWGTVAREHVVGSVQYTLWTRGGDPHSSGCGPARRLTR